MFLDIDDIDEADYLSLMYILNEIKTVEYGMRVEVLVKELENVLSAGEVDIAINKLTSRGLIEITHNSVAGRIFDRQQPRRRRST